MTLNSFEKFINYDLEYHYDCETHGCFDDICRCGSIVDVKINSVKLNKIVDYLFSEINPKSSTSKKRNLNILKLLFGGDEVDKYCIDRILKIEELYNKINWQHTILNGYYGQELGKIFLPSDVFDRIMYNSEKVISMDSVSDKIKFVLLLEYGYLLKELEDKEFEIITIKKEDLDLNKLNKDYINKIKSEKLDYYSDKNYSLPRGVVIGDRIIDGYHRILATQKSQIKVFKSL